MRERFSVYQIAFVIILSLSLWGLAVQDRTAAQDGPPADMTAESTPEQPPLDVPTEVPTEVPTDLPTETPTEAPPATSEVTIEPTSEATVEVTEEPLPTDEATQEVVPTDTVETATPTDIPEVLPPVPSLSRLVNDDFNSGSLVNWVDTTGWALVTTEGGQALQTTYSEAPVISVYNNIFDGAVIGRFMVSAGSARLNIRQSEIGAYSVTLSADGQVELSRAGTILESAQVGVSQSGQWRELRLLAVAGGLRVAVDGVEVITYLDAAPLPPGTVSFGIGGSGSVVWADDLQIWVPTDQIALFVTPTPVPDMLASAQDEPMAPMEETLPSGAKRFTVNSEDARANFDTGDGFCTLFEAMLAANGESNDCGSGTSIAGAPDEIYFNITDPSFGNPPYQLVPVACQLPTIEDPVIINGYSQSGATEATSVSSAILRIELVGTAAAGICGGVTDNKTDGIEIGVGGSGSIIQGLSISRFPGDAIRISGADNVVIRGNFIGTDVSGVIDFGLTTGDGVKIIPSDRVDTTPPNTAVGNVIGGTAPGDRNIISANNSDGVEITTRTDNNVVYGATGNYIIGNYIGVDVTGTVALPNKGNGVFVNGVAANFIGDDDACTVGNPCSRNIISGNELNGVELRGTSASFNAVQNNYVGLNAAGTARVPNKKDGVVIAGGSNNLIGGLTANTRNTITGNTEYGIQLKADDGSFGGDNRIIGNFIGTNPSGTGLVTTSNGATPAVLITGNAKGGIWVNGAFAFIIGGETAASRNVISGNQGAPTATNVYGIRVEGNASLGYIIGNYIGTDVNGTAAVPNRTGGILITGQTVSTEIGGLINGRRNVISGNGGVGIELNGINVTGTRILGNFIGTDASGTADLGNATDGVRINGAPNNFIGDPDVNGRNVIAGNDGDGIEIISIVSPVAIGEGTRVQNNLIGLNLSQNSLPNGGNGVRIATNARRNQIGADPNSETDTSGNIIAFNTLAGVAIESTAGTGNAVMKNQLRSNGTLGIDLAATGVTPNDGSDVDTGPNNTQNFPVLTFVDRDTQAGTLQIDGRLSSNANTDFRIDFFANSTCDPSGYGEGQVFLGSILNATTDAQGILDFTETFPDPVDPNMNWITFTATEKKLFGNLIEYSTSEFSPCVDRNNNPPTISPIPMPNITVNHQTPTGNLPITITDVEPGTLTLSGSSSNPVVVPNNAANFDFQGSGSSRTVRVIPGTGASAYGTTLITITVTDPQGASASTTFTLTVRPPNVPPTIGIISAQSTTISEPTPPIAINLTDADGNVAAVTVTASSTNTTLVPNTLVGNDTTPGYFFEGTGASRTLTIIPSPGQTGSALVTVTATDQDGGQATRQFDLNVSVNTAPTISNIADQSKPQNAATGNINFTIGDGQTNPSQLQLSFASSNTTLVPNANFTFGGSGTSRNVNITPVNGEYGLTTITITVTDPAGLSASDSFLLGIYKTGNATAPTITSVADQTIAVSTETNLLNFTVGDNETAAVSIQVFTSSDNPTLVPNDSTHITIASGGSGARTVRVTPVVGLTGIANITLTAYDNEGRYKNDTFKVTVNPNNPPTISSNISNVNRPNSNLFSLSNNFTIIDDWTDEALLVITATSSNTDMIPNSSITPTTSSPTARNLNIDPVDGEYGTSTITIRVTDPTDGQFSTKSFLVSVADPANTSPPTITNIPNQPASLMNQVIGPIAFTVGDNTPPTGGINNLLLTYTSSNTTLVPEDDAHITFGGTGANRTVTITPAHGQIGTATITITVDDLRGRTASDSFAITVDALPNTPPTISAIANQFSRPGVVVGPLNFTVGDDRPISALSLDVSSTNTTLIPLANINVVGTGADRSITLTPVNGQQGTSTITLVLTDGDLETAVETFDVVIAFNASPTINNVADQTTPPNVRLGPVALTLSDDATNPDNLVVTATSSNQTLVPNQNILIGGVGANRSLFVLPASNQTGTSTITITVADDEGGSSQDTFMLTVILAPPQLTAPKEDSIVTKVRPTFTWRSIRNIRKYEIQIADNAGFSSPISAQVGSASYTMPASGPALGQGTIYWRVRALDTNSNPVTEWSEAGTFTVSILKSPRDGAFTTDATPAFTWYAVPNITAYTLLVDDDPNFGSPIADFCTSPTRTTCTPSSSLTPGTYYWKVNINGTVSPVSWSFIVTPSIPLKPKLVSPASGAKVTDPTPTLDWDAVVGTGMTYELLVDDASNFKSPIVSPPASASTDFTFSGDLAEGRYYWKVRAINQYGVPGPWSSSRSFIVDAILLISPADESITTNSKPTFRWGSAGAGATYQLQIDDAMNFSSPMTPCSSPTATSCTLATPLTPGVYYWRVNVNGQTSPYVWSFIYTLPAPAAPKQVNPANNAVLNDTTPTLSWTPVTGAATYEVQVASNSRFEPMVFTIDGVTNPFTTVTTSLTDGRYLWRVRSVNNLGVPGRWSSTRSFTIDTLPPTAPVLTSPAANVSIGDSTPTLKWRSISGVRRYWVQVATDANFNTIVVDANQVSSASYTVPNALALGAGTYYWRVRAIDPAGNIGPVSTVLSFTVN